MPPPIIAGAHFCHVTALLKYSILKDVDKSRPDKGGGGRAAMALNRMDGSWDGGAFDLPLTTWIVLLAPGGILNVDCEAEYEERLKSALQFAGFESIASAAAMPQSDDRARVRVSASKPAT